MGKQFEDLELGAGGKRGGRVGRWRPEGQIGFTRKGGAELTREKASKEGVEMFEGEDAKEERKEGGIVELVERKGREENSHHYKLPQDRATQSQAQFGNVLLGLNAQF